MISRKNLLLILAAASVAITVIALLFGVFFMLFFLPIMFPLAFSRRKSVRKEEYRRSPQEQNPLRYEEDEDWREKWK